MNALIPKPVGRIGPFSTTRGFALVVTLSLMILLTVIAVGLLSLSSISLRSSSASNAQMIARTNAKTALMLAIGELQKQTGPDQRVTFTSEMPFGTSTTPPTNPGWTGAVSVKNLDPATKTKDSAVNWLVSGQNPDPAKALTKSMEWNKGDALQLATYFKPETTTKVEMLAPLVNLTQGNNRGRYAWWISDEGTKARVDLSRPNAAPANDREKLTRSQAPLEPGMTSLGATWKDLGPGSAIDKQSLISLSTASLATGNNNIPNEYFSDLTTGGFGLPTDVVDGGMKVDLSLIFDKSQQTKKYALNYFGADTPSMQVHKGAKIAKFTHDQAVQPAKDAKKFFLSDTLARMAPCRSAPIGGRFGTTPRSGRILPISRSPSSDFTLPHGPTCDSATGCPTPTATSRNIRTICSTRIPRWLP